MRELDNWVENFLEFTAGIPSPEFYRRWVGYGIISGVLERRIWTRMALEDMYPNLFILLVGNPGIGKSMAIKRAHKLWTRIGGFNVSPTSLTKAAFIDQMMAKTKNFTHGGRTTMYNALLIAASEFGTLLPDYDANFLSNLNDIYDCNDISESKTRGGGTISIQRPHITLISGTQPKYLGDVLPDNAYDLGFMSRMIMVYAGEGVKIDLFNPVASQIALEDKLITDLTEISELVGPMTWEKPAQEVAQDWYVNHMEDAPGHPKLQTYNNRRVTHGLKLAMIVALSRSDDFIVTLDDLDYSMKFMKYTESLMPEIFKEMGSSVDASEINEIHEYAYNYCRHREIQSIPEHTLIHFISGRVPVNKVSFFVETMVSAGLLQKTGLNLEGRRSYKPIRPRSVKPSKSKKDKEKDET